MYLYYQPVIPEGYPCQARGELFLPGEGEVWRVGGIYGGGTIRCRLLVITWSNKASSLSALITCDPNAFISNYSFFTTLYDLTPLNQLICVPFLASQRRRLGDKVKPNHDSVTLWKSPPRR